MTSHRDDRGRSAAAPKDGEVPSLPIYKAFVVQFTRETRCQAGVFSGRVEHMSSGRRARFASRKELLSVFQKMIDELGKNET